MNLDLLNALNRHTQEQFKEAKASMTTALPVKPVEMKIPDRKTAASKVVCYSADFFLMDDSPIFISIHDEGGNANIHYHDFFEINYVVQGEPIGVIDAQEIALKEGNLIIMNPTAVHYFKKYKDHEDIILNIVLPRETFLKAIYLPFISDSSLNAFFIRYQVENSQQPAYIFLESLEASTKLLIEMLVKEYIEKKTYSRVIIESLMTLLFSYIFRSYQMASGTENASMSEVLNYIYQNYQNLTLEAAARWANYHPKYLSSLIHQYTGKSFRDLMVQIRLQNAMNYLMYSNLPIEEIIEIIGYKEKSSFYHSFKKHYKVSPGEYRKHHDGLIL